MARGARGALATMLAAQLIASAAGNTDWTITHSNFMGFNDTLVPLVVGGQVWSDSSDVFSRVPVANGGHWPGLTYDCPTGDLTFYTLKRGYFMGWASTDTAVDGGLSDQSWDRTHTGFVVVDGVNFKLFMKGRFSGQVALTVPITRPLVGGFGFREERLAPDPPTFTVTRNGAPAKAMVLEPGV